MTSKRVSLVLIATIPALLCLGLMLAAYADIYKCTDEHGNVAYLQTPCPAEKAAEPEVADEEDAQAVEVEVDDYVPESTPEPQSPAAPIPSSREPGESLDECKKRYRDQIDVIDAEMRTAFSPDEGAAYKERLLALTKQLRACE